MHDILIITGFLAACIGAFLLVHKWEMSRFDRLDKEISEWRALLDESDEESPPRSDRV